MLVAFNWFLSNSKSPQVSRTLLSILADLNNGVVGKVSVLLLISFSSSFFSKPLETVPSASTSISILVSFILHFFPVLWEDPSICLSFGFVLFSLCGQMEQQNPLVGKFFFVSC